MLSKILPMRLPQPAVLGLRKSFGFGDRLGLATPGHLAAAQKSDFAPIFAQQSIREMARTQRTPEEVMRSAQSALAQAAYTSPWGADADHLKTAEDVQRTAAAGFCFFTIDPSEVVNNHADALAANELETGVARLEAEGIFPDRGWQEFYLGQHFDPPGGPALRFTKEKLFRAAIKYARAIAQSASMGEHVATAMAGRPYEIEVSGDETDSPTSGPEHLFFALHLEPRRVDRVATL